MFEFRLDENDNKQRFREQILLSFFKFHLCLIDAMNDFYERIFQINKNNEKCFTFRTIIKIEKLTIEKINFRDYTIREKIFYKNDNLWVFEKINLLMKIIKNVHDQFFCVHSSMNRIEKLIKQYYYWFNIRKVIKRYIRNCHNYQWIKSSHDEQNELFRSLFIFVQRWIDISMNFIINLFKSKKHNVICIIINRFFKKRHYVFYIVDKKNIVVDVCVRILFHYIFRIHELSSFIILNRDNQFVNIVWNFFLQKIKHQKQIVYCISLENKRTNETS